MPDTKDEKTDCEVCKRLIKEKHRWNFVWKIACFIFAVLALVFAILYFGSGAITTETTYTVEDNTIKNNGDDGTIIIGNEGEISGTVERKDYTPIICISIIAGAVIIVFGGIIIAHHHKKNN